MALKSNREGLRNELVDYLGNIIIDKKLKQDIITAIDDVYVNESDVLTLEEILASTDLSGKIASASSIKSVSDLVNFNLEVPNAVSGSYTDIVENCKYISSIIEPYKPRMILISNQNKGLVIGYTYSKSISTRYARYIYINISSNYIYTALCYNSIWTVSQISGVSIND